MWKMLRRAQSARQEPALSRLRRARLEVEVLEDRLVPSWAGVPPALVNPAALAATAVVQNDQGDATGTASVVANEADYYGFTALTGGSYRLAAARAGGSLDTVLGVFNSSGLRIAYNDDISSSNTDSLLYVNLTAGQRYYFGISNYTGSPGGSYGWTVDGPALGGGYADDAYENNDSFAGAYNLGTLTARRTINNLVMADNADWFRFSTQGNAGASDYVGINFDNARGDLDLALFDSAGNRLQISQGTGNSENIALAGLPAATYFVQVYGYQGTANPNYSLDITPPALLADDVYENNDSFAQAYNLGTLTAAQAVNNLVMADSHDWFKFTMQGPGTSSNYLSISFQNSRGDLDLALYDSAGTPIGLSDGTIDSESIALDGLAAGTYYVDVYGYQGAFNSSYSLEVNPGRATPTPPPSTGSFRIDLSFSGLTTSQQTIFQQAAARWEQIITGDVPDASYNGRPVDDIWIEARVVSIDGPYGILGQAGPDYVRGGSYLPIHGTMEFDSADIARLEASGGLLYTIEHEMGHVLGIGTVWPYLGLVSGAGSSNSQFTGAQATAEYNSIFGVWGSGVPLENSMGAGSNDSHWRESLFGSELMSPMLNSGFNPISRVTIASLADLGYQVNLNAADPYTPAGLSSLTSSSTDGTGTSLLAGDPGNSGGSLQGPAFSGLVTLARDLKDDGPQLPATGPTETRRTSAPPGVGAGPQADQSRLSSIAELVAHRLHGQLPEADALELIDMFFMDDNVW